VTKKLAIVLLTAFSAAGCQKQTRYRVTLLTDQPWTVGEARTCSFVDEKRDVMRCATPSKGSPETWMSREYLRSLIAERVRAGLRNARAKVGKDAEGESWGRMAAQTIPSAEWLAWLERWEGKGKMQ
jgi:hypothetical protein